MKTVKQIKEELEALVLDAETLWDVRENKRDWTPEENERYKALGGEGGLIDQKKAELESAKQLEDSFKKISQEKDLQKTQERIAELKTAELSRTRVLPSNGILPEEESEEPRVHVRAAKLRAFKSEKDAWNSGMWMRAIVARMQGNIDRNAELECRRNGMSVDNTMQESSGTLGGYLVPPQMSQTIIDVRESVGIARRVCQIQAMTGDMVSIPKRSGGLTVYYPNELQEITASDKTWQQVNLAAEKRGVLAKISQELVDDALISIVDNVVSEMAYALALREDQELINGDATSSYGHVYGLRNAIGSAGVYTTGSNDNLWSEIDLGDVVGTMAKLPDRFNRSPVWICSSNFFWAVFARLLAAGGGNAIANLEAGPGGTYRFLGIPVLTTSVMPTADADSTIHALFGQFDMAAVLGDRIGIRISRDDSLGFASDYVTLKATSRYDIKVHEPGDSSNAGAYVALKTNAA